MAQARLTLISILLMISTISTASPEQTVDSFHLALVKAMQADSALTRKTIIDEAIGNYFNVQTIARISLGRNWRTLDSEKQSAYIALMTELISSSYTSRFNNYDGQTFVIVESSSIASNRTRVKSVLNTNSEVVNLDYQLLTRNDTWRIYDIVANGVSDLSLKRSNYAALFASGGLEAVIADIRDSINKNQEI